MATGCCTLISFFSNKYQAIRGLWPGLLAAGSILLLAFLTLGSLWYFAPALHTEQNPAFWQDPYLWHVVGFTFWQALLSTLLSVLPALLLARALWRRRFPGRQLLLRLCAMTLVLPVLVAVFGLLSVYGRQGWLAHLCHWFGINYQLSPYGLGGILLAHTFFNLPLSTRLLLQALDHIPTEQRQLAAQLGLRGWNYWRFVEWPALRRQILPAASLIFMLCFTSFATVLALGGGPKATTIEVAIYQALSYDYDLQRAALLALLQLCCCLGLVILSQKLNRPLDVGHSQQQHWRPQENNRWHLLADSLIIFLALLLLLPPLIAIVFDGINATLWQVLQQDALWQALSTSLIIAVGAGSLCLLLCMMLLWSSRELKIRHQVRQGEWLELCGMLILALPGIVLATGFFLLLNATFGIPQSPYVLIIITNALMALPYALKVLEHPMRDLAERYQWLVLSLGMHGWQRLRLIELRALRRPIAQALSFACILSLGDFGVVALFGNENFRTLPFYLYQQIGSYRVQEGAVTALLLLLLCLLLFTLIERLAGHHADSD